MFPYKFVAGAKMRARCRRYEIRVRTSISRFGTIEDVSALAAAAPMRCSDCKANQRLLGFLTRFLEVCDRNV
jgi:hypothetical protein